MEAPLVSSSAVNRTGNTPREGISSSLSAAAQPLIERPASEARDTEASVPERLGRGQRGEAASQAALRGYGFFVAAAGPASPANTALRIGLTVCRYNQIARR